MKVLMLINFILFISSSFCFANKLECDMSALEKNLSTIVIKGSEIFIEGHEFISGHQWISIDGLESEIVEQAELGTTNTVVFVIKTADQQDTTKTYKFVYMRPWETEVLSNCNVKVTIK